MTSTDALYATIDEIRDIFARRAVALQTNGSAQSKFASSPGPRADAEPTDGIETLLWEDQKHLIPTRCPRPHCGSSLIQINQPYGMLVRGDATCVMCSRVLVNLKAAGTRPIPAPVSATACVDCDAQERVQGQRTCTDCTAQRESARLLAMEQMPPCADCGLRPRTIEHKRCNACRWSYSLELQGKAAQR